MNGQRQAFEMRLEHDWPLPSWLTLLLAIGIVVLMYYRFSRRSPEQPAWRHLALLSLRFVALFLVFVMMYGFVLRPYRTSPSDLVLLIDDSASMSATDAHPLDGRSELDESKANDRVERDRFHRVTDWLLVDQATILTKLIGNYQLRVRFLSGGGFDSQGVDFGELTRQIADHGANYSRSPLGIRVREILEQQRGRPTAAIVVFTDGVNTEGATLESSGDDARGRDIALFLVGVGQERSTRDIRLRDVIVDDVAYVHDVVPVEVTLTSSACSGDTTTLTLSDTSGKVLDERPITIATDGVAQQESLMWRPVTTGLHELTVNVQGLAGETDSGNNEKVVRVDVRDSVLRVLLVQTYPSYEFRYLKNVLGRGAVGSEGEPQSICELTTILQEADAEYVDIDNNAQRVFPTRWEALLEYDVIILGDVAPEFLGPVAMENIVRFVREHGGGALLIAGQRYNPQAYRDTPLAELLPLRLGETAGNSSTGDLSIGMNVRLSHVGDHSPFVRVAMEQKRNLELWRAWSPYWGVPDAEPLPGTHVLVEAADRTSSSGFAVPLICHSYVGPGNVVMHTSDDLWRWQFTANEQAYVRYWMQTIRFLGRPKMTDAGGIRLQAEREQYRFGDAVTLSVRFLDERTAPEHDDEVSVIIGGEGGQDRSVQLHRWTGLRGFFLVEIPQLLPGRYHARLAAPQVADKIPACDFEVIPPDTELTGVDLDEKAMRAAAEISRGKYYRMQDVEQMLHELPLGSQLRVEALPSRPIWNSSLVAALFMASLSCEWILRKRWGLA
ncbi:MAG: hypothetical protein KDA99_04600 [Planctomycetales bacterium]|nr:hypothetical protein [Planctomycetales bacterium]